MKVQKPELVRNNHLQTLINCRGFYDAPAAGPLVGYAGTYDEAKERHYVGFRYFNIAMAEQWPEVIGWFGYSLANRVVDSGLLSGGDIDVILGAPMGGIILGQCVAEAMGCRYVFAEKVVLSTGVDGQRGKEKLILGRHDIHPGERVGIVEDIANNYTTTLDLMKLVLEVGAIPVFLACAANRSDREVYVAEGFDPLPVASLIYQPTPQYRQDDPAVATLVQAGRVIWKPKHHWPELKAAMDAAIPR